jgi:hypothetical protein
MALKILQQYTKHNNTYNAHDDWWKLFRAQQFHFFQPRCTYNGASFSWYYVILPNFKLPLPTFWVTFSTVKVIYQSSQKHLIELHFGWFFTNLSGHPVEDDEMERLHITKKTNPKKRQHFKIRQFGCSTFLHSATWKLAILKSAIWKSVIWKSAIWKSAIRRRSVFQGANRCISKIDCSWCMRNWAEPVHSSADAVISGKL